MLFSGTPGTGKTTVAKAICNEFDLDFIVISRVDSNRARPGGIIMIIIMMIMIVTVMVQQGVGCYRGVGLLC